MVFNILKFWGNENFKCFSKYIRYVPTFSIEIYTFYVIYFLWKGVNPLFFIPQRNKRLKKLRVNLDSNYRGAFNLFNTCKFYILSIKKIKKNS